MKEISKLLHHAYLIPTYGCDVLVELENNLNNIGIKTKGNPDYILWRVQTFGIDDAYDLRLWQTNKNISSKQCFVIESITITKEAQNALLKTFEEPSENTHFFLCVYDIENILPTLRSRMVIVNINKKQKLYKHADIFLKKTPGERIQYIEKIIKEKNRKEELLLLNELETYLNDYLQQKKIKVNELRDTLFAIYNARELIVKNIGNQKILLENISLICPTLI